MTLQSMLQMAVATGLTLGLAGCGGSGGGTTGPAATPTSPTGPTAPPVGAGTLLTIVSGEDDRPVSGARVSVDGATFTTNSAGQVTLPQRPAEMAPIDILAAGFLDRLTVFRGQETRLTLWPRTSPTGLTEYDTKCLVYTNVRWDGEGPLLQIGPTGADSLRQRYSRAPVKVFYSTGFDAADSRAIEAQVGAVTDLNQAIGGGLTYLPPSLGEIPPSGTGELHVALTIDPAHESCVTGGVSATGQPPPAGPASGVLRVNYCAERVARNRLVALHELGHTFGLRHSESPTDLMCPTIQTSAFSPKERLVLRLMLQRRPGNVFPDTDVCRWRSEWCVD